MHTSGSYDDEAQTDAGKVVLEKLKTVVWHPIARWLRLRLKNVR